MSYEADRERERADRAEAEIGRLADRLLKIELLLAEAAAVLARAVMALDKGYATEVRSHVEVAYRLLQGSRG